MTKTANRGVHVKSTNQRDAKEHLASTEENLVYNHILKNESNYEVIQCINMNVFEELVKKHDTLGKQEKS